jgi:hypothetical protein
VIIYEFYMKLSEFWVNLPKFTEYVDIGFWPDMLDARMNHDVTYSGHACSLHARAIKNHSVRFSVRYQNWQFNWNGDWDSN